MIHLEGLKFQRSFKDEIKFLFGNIKTIYKKTCDFYSELLECNYNWELIAKKFIQHVIIQFNYRNLIIPAFNFTEKLIPTLSNLLKKQTKSKLLFRNYIQRNIKSTILNSLLYNSI